MDILDWLENQKSAEHRIAADEIKLLRTKAIPEGWISVDDEPLPTKNDSILVANSNFGLVAPMVNNIINNNLGTKWDWLFGIGVTHWMPLPNPPAMITAALKTQKAQKATT